MVLEKETANAEIPNEAQGKTAAKNTKLAWADIFADPVIDYRLAPNPPPSNIFGPSGTGLSECQKYPETKTQKESLESTALGNSVLHRMFEVAALTPNGKLSADEFEKVYGAAAAAKMNELGINQVERKGNQITVHLNNPLHFGDNTGSIDISKTVSFQASSNHGAISMENVNGVSASNGLFQVPINTVELQAHKEGYMSGSVQADWSQTNVCAVPNGKIYH